MICLWGKLGVLCDDMYSIHRDYSSQWKNLINHAKLLPIAKDMYAHMQMHGARDTRAT